MKSTVLNLNPFDLMVHAFNLLASNIISTLICEIFKVENDCFKRIFSKFLKSFLLLFFFPFHSFQFLFHSFSLLYSWFISLPALYFSSLPTWIYSIRNIQFSRWYFINHFVGCNNHIQVIGFKLVIHSCPCAWFELRRCRYKREDVDMNQRTNGWSTPTP